MTKTVDLDTAIAQAVCAPSIHNSQPWRWRVAANTIDLHADLTRHLPWTDPDRRDLLLSCGAALHHLRVALAADGFGVEVRRLANPDNEWHLATVLIRPGDANPHDAALSPAIGRRRTDRRRMSHQPVPDRLIGELADLVTSEGAALLPVADSETRDRLDAALNDAAREQSEHPGYATELQLWTHRYAGSSDGIARTHVATPMFGNAMSPLRSFAEAGLAQPHIRPGAGDGGDAAQLFVVATDDDDRAAWLRAGEALSALLLGATLQGLATTPLSQGIEVPGTRDRIRQQILQTTQRPQILVRVGWPAAGAVTLPATARRDLHRVVTHVG